MGKNREINFVGQPVLKQIMEIATGIDIKSIIREQQSDRYYKSFGSMTQLVTMLFGILSRRDSMTEVCEGLRGMGGKLNHLGLKKSPAKSTASDGLRNRDSGFFESVYFSLVKHYQSFLSDSRTFGLTFKEVLLVDSTTIRLFSDILKGVGRNPKGDGKKKGGLKVHMLIDAVQSVGRFVKITEAKVHDKNFLLGLELVPHSVVVFDRAYNYYLMFARWTEKRIYFVTRMKKNAVYTVKTTLRKHYRKKGQAKVLRDEIVALGYHPEDENGRKITRETLEVTLRRVCYQDEMNRYYEFLTNNMDITAEGSGLPVQEALDNRIAVQENEAELPAELLLRGEHQCYLYAGMVYTHRTAAADRIAEEGTGEKAFSVVATLVRIHLISLLDVYQLLKSGNRHYNDQDGPPDTGQLALF